MCLLSSKRIISTGFLSISLPSGLLCTGSWALLVMGVNCCVLLGVGLAVTVWVCKTVRTNICGKLTKAISLTKEGF